MLGNSPTGMVHVGIGWIETLLSSVAWRVLWNTNKTLVFIFNKDMQLFNNIDNTDFAEKLTLFYPIRVDRFIPKLSQLIPLSGLNPATSPCSMESGGGLAGCVHKGWWLECWRGPVSCPTSLERRGGGLRLDLYSDRKVYPGPDLEGWLSCKFIASPATSR